MSPTFGGCSTVADIILQSTIHGIQFFKFNLVLIFHPVKVLKLLPERWIEVSSAFNVKGKHATPYCLEFEVFRHSIQCPWPFSFKGDCFFFPWIYLQENTWKKLNLLPQLVAGSSTSSITQKKILRLISKKTHEAEPVEKHQWFLEF